MTRDFFNLKSINIIGYKNINNLEIGFADKNGITVLIGNNGCGKSNILEAISSIFAGLYNNKIHKTEFRYQINYEINGSIIEINYTNPGYSFKVNDNDFKQTEFMKQIDSFLPKNVIACYSGESQRLWQTYYLPFFNKYVSTIRKLDKIPELPMLYINRENLSISLLTLFMFDFDQFLDIRSFCQKELNIKEIKNITFYLNVKKIKTWNDNSVIQMIKSLNSFNESLNTDSLKLSLNEVKQRLEYLGGERNIFKTLYAATMSGTGKVINNIDFDIILNNGETIRIDDLSEGEKKNLLLTAILEVLADENSLLLFDEPDSHIHISKKAKLKDLFNKYLHREKIITTHSPTLAVTFEGHIEGLGRDENGHTTKIDNDKAKLVSSITEGLWNVHEQNMFLSSNKPMTLLVEGKTDKIHFEEAYKHLKKEYPLLDFDVFSMNSSEHIREVLIGLSCSEINWDKQFVGIFDNDQAGQKDISNGFEKEDIDVRIKHVKYKNGTPSTSFYAFLLPKPKEFSDKDFTIENCFDASKFEEAYFSALEGKRGHFNSLSINTIAEDLKNKSKTILAMNAKHFIENDFVGFKPIFDLLEVIRKKHVHID